MRPKSRLSRALNRSDEISAVHEWLDQNSENYPSEVKQISSGPDGVNWVGITFMDVDEELLAEKVKEQYESDKPGKHEFEVNEEDMNISSFRVYENGREQLYDQHSFSFDNYLVPVFELPLGEQSEFYLEPVSEYLDRDQ